MFEDLIQVERFQLNFDERVEKVNLNPSIEDYGFKIKGEKGFLVITNNKDTTIAGNVDYEPSEICTCLPTPANYSYVMSWGFTGCYFIVEKRTDNVLLVYHLTQQNKEINTRNKKFMATYIRINLASPARSSFWGVNPKNLVGDWSGKYGSEEGTYKSIVCVSDRDKNVFVYRTHYKNTLTRTKTFCVDEREMINASLIWQDEALANYLDS